MNDPETRLSSRDRRLLRRILAGRSNANIRFAEFRRLLLNMGFAHRIRGSHHNFTMDGLERPLTVQSKAAVVPAYQLQQFKGYVIRQGLIPK